MFPMVFGLSSPLKRGDHLVYLGGKIITNYDGNGTAKDVTTYDKDGNVTEIQ